MQSVPEGQGRALMQSVAGSHGGQRAEQKGRREIWKDTQKTPAHSPRIFSLWKLISLSPKRNSGHFNIEQLSPLMLLDMYRYLLPNIIIVYIYNQRHQ